MSGSQIFVGIFAFVSVIVSASAIWRVATASGITYKPLWIAGSLFGFVGFATSLSHPTDLYLQFGIQVPVLTMWMTGSGDLILKALFPVVAVAALIKAHSSSGRPDI
jgi:hypothetical protein